MKKIFLFLFFISSISISYAQEKKDKLKFSDLPGAFVFEIGATRYFGAPKSMELKAFPSRGINIYYTYDFKLIGDNVSFSPGLGVGINNYTFKDPVTLGYSADRDSLKVVNIFNDYKGLKKTKLAANYLDIPLELRFRTSADVNSFKVAVGVRGGILISSLTKIKYKDDGVKKIKRAENFELERFRYGAHVRIGYGAFHLFGYYSLSELFQKDKGPDGKSITPFMVGIALSTY